MVKIRTRSALLLLENLRGTCPANFHTFPSFFRWRTIVNLSTMKYSASSSSSSTAYKSAWSSKSDDRPLPSLSLRHVLPDFKPSFNLFLFNWETINNLTKCLCRFPSEMGEHYMTNMIMTFDTPFFITFSRMFL